MSLSVFLPGLRVNDFKRMEVQNRPLLAKASKLEGRSDFSDYEMSLNDMSSFGSGTAYDS